MRAKFYEENTNNDIGEIAARYVDDLEIDIKYYSGEMFYGKDIINQEHLYSIDELTYEMIDYMNNIIELYEKLYNVLKNDIQLNPLIKSSEIKKVTEYNLDSFFKSDKRI